MKLNNRLTLSTSPLSQPARKPRKTASLARRQRLLYGRTRRHSAVKERDTETGLYYYGARYLDGKTSRWLSGDPAMGDYVPSAPVNDEARKRNGNLPGMGGVFNYVNLHVYHYAGNNPVRLVDPDGRNFEYSIDDEKKTITINVDIVFYGEDATNEVVQLYKKGVDDTWGGSRSTRINGKKYSVNFNVNVSIGEAPDDLASYEGPKNYIKADASTHRSEVVAGYMGTWRAKGRDGNTLAQDNPAAHEFGHLLGFDDRYTDSGGASKRWKGNIMAEPAMRGVVQKRNIDAISGYITKQSMPKKGVIKPREMLY